MLEKNTRLPWISKWLKMTQDQVLDKFQGIPNSYTDGRGQKRFVYIPGNRKDRILIVAHADTVWRWIESGADSRIKLCMKDGELVTGNADLKYKVQYSNGKTHSEKGIGIGADDRAGCGIAWHLRNLGHSILITSGEENGCIATNRLMKNRYWSEELNKHHFAVQFDRKGSKDIVFYDVGTNKFAEYVKEQTKYIPASGTTTDIRHLCTKMCGVNMSVGYYNEHTVDEKLVISEFENTLNTAEKWLSQADIPEFKIEKSDIFEIVRKHKERKWLRKNFEDEYEWYDKWEKYGSQNMAATSSQIKSSIVCPYCGHKYPQEIWLKNHFVCERCGNG